MAKKFDFKKIGMRILGVSAGAGVSVIADKPMANMNPKLRAGIKIIAGAVIPELAPKSAFIGSMGDGLVAGGAIDLTKDLMGTASNPPVEGIGDEGQFNEDQYVVDPDTKEVAGTQEDPMSGVIEVVSGVEDNEEED